MTPMQSGNDPNGGPHRTELDAILDAGLARRGTPAPLEARSGPLLEELDSLLAGRRTAPPPPLAERDPAIPSEAFLWLALAPVWTVSAAEATRLPSGKLKQGELLERLADRGLLATGMVRPRTELKKLVHPETKPWSPSARQRTYRMSQVGRAAVLRPLLSDGNRRVEIERALHEVGAAVMRAEKSGAVVLPECRRWGALAEMGASKAARAFAAQFDAALAANDSAEAL